MITFTKQSLPHSITQATRSPLKNKTISSRHYKITHDKPNLTKIRLHEMKHSQTLVFRISFEKIIFIKLAISQASHQLSLMCNKTQVILTQNSTNLLISIVEFCHSMRRDNKMYFIMSNIKDMCWCVCIFSSIKTSLSFPLCTIM